MARKRKQAPLTDFAVPPSERAQHDALEVKNHDPQNRGARRVQVKLPNRLRKYRALGSITEDQLLAGEELATDWETAGKLPKQTVNLLSTGGGHRDMTQRQVDAHDRLVKALDGPRKRFADLLVSVCCFDQPAPSVPKLSGALELLARHYRIGRCAC
jgi:hypothetical protein